MSRFIIRNADMGDLDGVYRLARMLNTMNLPDEVEALRDAICKSVDSFQGFVTNPLEREYVFVVEDSATRQIVGTSQIIAQHGTRDAPHVFYDVQTVEHYSKSIDRLFKHFVLRLGFDYDGPTEVGGLVVDPEYRHSIEKIGKQLSFVRFLFIGMHRQQFKNRLLAELLPPLSPTGQSLLWEALGRRFTGLDYMQADHISRTNKEFIKSLFPTEQIYTTLFDDETQEVIGAVGRTSETACRLLSEIGFAYQSRVDPFDGGPHFEADTDDVTLVQETRKGLLDVLEKNVAISGPMQRGLIAVFKNPFESNSQFRAISTSYVLSADSYRVLIDASVLARLGGQIGDTAYFLNLDPAT